MKKLLLLLLFTTAAVFAQNNRSRVNIVGAMRNVMWKGQLQGSINLDTISDRKNLYGLGPVEGLAGELLIINGKAYKSTVVSAAEMKVEETYKAKAPFFVYGYADKFSQSALPSTINDLSKLEAYLDDKTKSVNEPYIFVLKGTVNSASVHVVNLPEGSKVSSPDDAHRGQVSYKVENTPVEIVGFFSRSHQSVFTHHDTFMHLHLITKNGTIMGHLDAVEFKPGGMQLYLPFN
jgi:acetolactate decarboxylase